MALFPTLSGGRTALMYPLQETISTRTKISTFCNDSEQRFRQRTGLRRFTLAMVNLTAADVALIKTFWTSTKAGFDTTWGLVVGATTYNNLCFEGDDMAVKETSPNLYDLSFNVIQTK
jgi:hypothetical protein